MTAHTHIHKHNFPINFPTSCENIYRRSGMNNICICAWQETAVLQTLNKSSSWIVVNIWTVSGSSESNALGWLMAVKRAVTIPGRGKAGSRKGKNAELDPSANIIHRVKQAYYYWRYTKLELADSTIISLRHWHRLTPSRSLYVSASLSLTPPPFSCPVPATRRHSSHALAAAGGCFLLLWCRDASDMAEQLRHQSAYASSQVGAIDLTLLRYAFGSKVCRLNLFFLSRSVPENGRMKWWKTMEVFFVVNV